MPERPDSVHPDSDPVERARRLAEVARDRKGQRVVAMDMRGLTTFAEAFVLATGTSDRHVRSIADAVVEAATALGTRPLGVEGADEGRWVLIDLNDVVVHVFLADVRELYDLDRLWADAPRITADAEAEAGAAAVRGEQGRGL